MPAVGLGDSLQLVLSRRTLFPSTTIGSTAVTWPTCGISCSRSSEPYSGRLASGGTQCLTGTTTARWDVCWDRRGPRGGELTEDRAAMGGGDGVMARPACEGQSGTEADHGLPGCGAEMHPSLASPGVSVTMLKGHGLGSFVAGTVHRQQKLTWSCK